jgi:hypothetical protein
MGALLDPAIALEMDDFGGGGLNVSLPEESPSLYTALFRLDAVLVCVKRAFELAGLSPCLSLLSSDTFTFLLMNSSIAFVTLVFCRISVNLPRTSARNFSIAELSCVRESFVRYVCTSNPTITNSTGATFVGL